MKVIIIEDEQLAVDRLRLLLHDYDSDIEIIATLDGVMTAIEWFNAHPPPDLAFVDIELADGTSFSIFSKIKVKCPVIFTTAYDQYAMDAFKLLSIDYLLKPVTLPALSAALQKYRDMITFQGQQQGIEAVMELMGSFKKNYKERFLVKSGTRLFFVEVNNVAYFSADDKTVFLITREGVRFIVEYTLDKLQELLDPKFFFRLNRKIITGIDAIKEIRTYFNNRLIITLQAGTGKEDVVVSRDRVAHFKSWAEL
ncbi:MAG TPA: LytTR family DNA-binding domain-containing protein [Agriterribacter sp.]|nr:LytTR family DNA-binding domain-containing protein [Agriterribacter sp.]